MDDAAKPQDAIEAPNWRSPKLWYSVGLQGLATGLLWLGKLNGDQWVWVSTMIYGGYVLGTVGVAFAGGSLTRK